MQIDAPREGVTPPRRISARHDVTKVVDEQGHWFVHAELVIPADAAEAEHLTLLCCTPGGGCTGNYFDLGEPESGYSFAHYAATAGFACVLIDNLGTGRSTPLGDLWLSPQSMARAGAEAFRSTTAELRTSLPTSNVSTIGIGHSMGAMLMLMAQAMVPLHTAIACLGFTNAGLPGVLSPEERRIAAEGPVSLETLTAIARQRFTSAPPADVNHSAPEPFPFNLPDTDPVGLAAMRATATNLLPLPATLSLLPGNVTSSIRNIDVPVFLGGGDHEPWHRAAELVPAFENSPDITFYTLADSAHNHNVATTRELLWRRLLGWAVAVTATQPVHSPS